MEVDKDDTIITSPDKKRTKVDKVDHDSDDDDVSPPSNSPRMITPPRMHASIRRRNDSSPGHIPGHGQRQAVDLARCSPCALLMRE
jgi:hypothetical protein